MRVQDADIPGSDTGVWILPVRSAFTQTSVYIFPSNIDGHPGVGRFHWAPQSKATSGSRKGSWRGTSSVLVDIHGQRVSRAFVDSHLLRKEVSGWGRK